jgi:pyruvate/2-oxoglutarate dehydrogenase complex dihydrolipoamide dehydrogenase (E3) component
MTAQHYDPIVIGSAPAEQKSAIHPSKLGKRVAVIEHGMIGALPSTAAPFQVKLCARPSSIPRKETTSFSSKRE